MTDRSSANMEQGKHYSAGAADGAVPTRISRRSFVALAALASGLGCACVLRQASSFGVVTGMASEPVQQESSGADEDLDLAELVAQKVMPSVGSIYALVMTSGSLGISSGSCVIVDESGYLITNYHVIEGYEDAADEDGPVVQVVLDNIAYDAEVVGYDSSSDIAVIRIDAPDRELVALPFGDSDALMPGSWVMTVGCPYGEDTSVSVGIVSGVSRTAAVSLDQTTAYYVGMIQTDAMINSGSSGGALVNAAGELVGMTALSATTSGDFAGMSYAIPSNYISDAMAQILETGTVIHPMLGVKVTNMSDYYSYYSAYGAKNVTSSTLLGAYVAEVISGGGADIAGVEAGDIIVALDDEMIYSGDDLIIQVRSHDIGETVTLTIERGDETIEIDVTLTADTIEESQQGEDEESDGISSIFDRLFGGSNSGSGSGSGYGPGGYGGYGFGGPGSSYPGQSGEDQGQAA